MKICFSDSNLCCWHLWSWQGSCDRFSIELRLFLQHGTSGTHNSGNLNRLRITARAIKIFSYGGLRANWCQFGGPWHEILREPPAYSELAEQLIYENRFNMDMYILTRDVQYLGTFQFLGRWFIPRYSLCRGKGWGVGLKKIIGKGPKDTHPGLGGVQTGHSYLRAGYT